jgi:hypothetical protein
MPPLMPTPEEIRAFNQQHMVAPHLFAKHYSGGAWKPWRALQYVSWAIADTIATPGGRLIVNMPPGSGKSELLAFWTPIMLLERDARRRLLLAMSTTELAHAMGGRVRDEFATNAMLATRLKADTKSKGRWKTSGGGGMIGLGVGKAAISIRADVIIIDDPYPTWADAQSSVFRRNVDAWVTGTISNRLEPGGQLIVINHRMHPQDLTASLLRGEDAGRWKHISLPAVATGDNDPLGRKPGEVLTPERFSLLEMEQKRLEAKYTWEPMYQQNPEAAVAGAVYSRFRQENIRHDLAIRKDLPVHITIDWNLNPGMHLYVGQHDPRQDTFSTVHEIHGPRMAIDLMAKTFVELWKTWDWKPEVHIFGDATGVTMTDGKRYGTALKMHLQAAGIRFRDRIPASNPGVIESVQSVNDALADTVTGERRYFVHPRCDRLIRDFREVMPDDEGKPDKDRDSDLTHASDTQRYWVHYLRPLRVRRPTSGTRDRPADGFVFGTRS